MQEASFSGFFKTIVYMIGFYYLIRFLARIFMPIILKKVVDKAQENFAKQHNQNNQNQDFNINDQDSKNGNPKSTKKVGDYIDYEEIK